MKRHFWPAAAIVALLLPATLDASAEEASKSVRPNFIVILADDLGYGDLGCFGSSKIKTPNLDRMAAEGARFTHFYAQAVCGPSRAALMTGCYPIRIAEPGNRKNQHTILHPREVTIAEVLKPAGYGTACMGKWHLGASDPSDPTGWNGETMPNAKGFDYFYGTPLYNGYSVRVQDVPFRSQILRNREIAVDKVESWDHITQDLTREAQQFIRANREKPFFLYLAHSMPHIPLGASERFKGKSAGGPFGDAAEELDWSTGELLQTLRELGLDERTMVIFTSDNGPWIETTTAMDPRGKPFIPRDHSGHAEPLRGYKMLTWEGGLRVPFIARWPGKILAASVCAEVATTMDFLPTLTALAGGKLPDVKLDGRDIQPLLFGQPGAKSPHDAFFFYCYTHLQAVRSGPWKLVLARPEHPAWVGWSGRFVGNGVAEPQLYDLRADIGEQHDVSASHPDIVARLMEHVRAARVDLGDHDVVGRQARFFDPGQQRPDRNILKKKAR